MAKIKFAFLLIATILFSCATMAQSVVASVGEKKEFMRSNEKVYVVMAVVLIILGGLFMYVYRLDRKISQLEKGIV